MLTRSALLPLLLAFSMSTCKKHENLAAGPQAQNPTPKAFGVATASPSTNAAANSPAPKTTKPVVDQAAQVIVFGYHRFVNSVRRPDTEITPAAFEEQMVELKNRGITVIGMQDFLAWRRGEKIFRRAAPLSPSMTDGNRNMRSRGPF